MSCKATKPPVAYSTTELFIKSGFHSSGAFCNNPYASYPSSIIICTADCNSFSPLGDGSIFDKYSQIEDGKIKVIREGDIKI